MKHEDFCFCSFIFSFLSHRKHRTVKGVEVKLRKHFPSDARLKILHLPIPSSEAIGNLLQFSQFLQWQRRSSSGLSGICSDWGVRNSPVRIAYTVRNMIALRILLLKIPTVVVLCASCPKISIHLTVISLNGIYVLSCRAAPSAINSRPLQPLAGWLLREKLTLVIWEHPILRGLWVKIIELGKPKPKVIEHHWRDWSCVDPTLITFEDCASSRWLGVMV